MKKALKVILYFLGSIVLLLVLVLIFHNAIINYTLKTIISNKSEGRASLVMKDFDLNLQEGSILILNPEMKLNGVYLDSSQNMSIDRIVFDFIEIDRLDLKELIKERNIDAIKFIVDKPEFWFTELGKSTTSSFHPDKLFAALNHNPGLFKTLQVKIDDIEIHYGSINISEHAAPEVNPGVVDFTIMMRDFNSSVPDDSTQNRILFSEELMFKLKDFNRKLKSGYLLSIDSAVFSSRKRGLLIGGASLLPGEENLQKNAIALAVGRLDITDIELEEVRGLEDLSIRSVHVSDGYLSMFINEEKKEKKEKSNNEGIEELKKIFAEFELDSIAINHFGFYNIIKGKDTSIAAQDVNFLITGVKIDSGMFDDPFREFLYDTIKLSTAQLELNQLVPGLKVNYQGLSYSNFHRNLKIAGLIVKKDSTSKNKDVIDVSLRELDVRGFSLKRFQKKQTQRLAVRLIDPEINLAIFQTESQKKKNKKEPVLPKHLQLEKVIVQNGNLNLNIEDKTEVALKGLNIDVEEFYFPDKTDTNFRYENLSFSYENLIGQVEDQKYQFVTGSLTYENRELLLKSVNATLDLGSTGERTSFETKYLELNDFDFDRLIFQNELDLSALRLQQPVLKGDFRFPKKTAQTRSPDNSVKQGFPITMNIGGIHVDKGKIDGVFDVQGKPLTVTTTYDVKIGSLNARKNDSLKILLNQIIWDARLSNAIADFRGHELRFDSLVTDFTDTKFKIDSLLVRSNPDAEINPEILNVRNLSLPILELSGLDYKQLLLNDSLDFETFRLDGLSLDAILPLTKDSVKEDQNKMIDIRPYLFFRYDTIILANMYLNIEKPGDFSHNIYQLKNFKIGHQKTNSSGLNLINDINFEFESLSYTDTISDKYLLIDKGFTNTEKRSFTIQGVEGSNLVKSTSGTSAISKSSIVFKSSQIKFENIYIEEQLPSKVKVGKLYVGDIDLDFQAAEKDNQDLNENTTFKVNLEILRRFSKVLTGLKVDTTDLNDISLKYRKLNDTTDTDFILDSVAFIVHNIDVDTTMIGQSQPQLVRQLTIDLRGKSHITKDSLYEIKTGRLFYDFPKNQISIDSLYVTPRFPDSVFFTKAVYQTDRLKLFGERIDINNIDFDELFNDKTLQIGSVDFHGFDVSMYRDKNFELRPGISPKLPREAIMAIGQKFNIDSIRFINAFLKYKELDKKSVNPGEIYFSDLNANAYNLTNILKENDRQTMIKLEASAKIMGESGLTASLFLPLYPDSTVFWLSAQSEEIDLLSVNSMTENLLGLGITRGKGSVDIPLIIANDSIVYGSLTFRFKKLKVAMYDREKDALSTKFGSQLINSLIGVVIRSKNPPWYASKPKKGLSYFERDTQKGIVNYVWKGVLTGLLSSIGYNNKEQRQERKELKKTP